MYCIFREQDGVRPQSGFKRRKIRRINRFCYLQVSKSPYNVDRHDIRDIMELLECQTC